MSCWRPFREFTREQADALVHAGLTRLEDLLQADESDLADIPQIGEQAAAILEAARAEAERRNIETRWRPRRRLIYERCRAKFLSLQL